MLYADFTGLTGNHDDTVSIYRELLARTDLSPRQAAVAANNLAFHLAEPTTAAEAEKLIAVAIAELGPHPDVLDTRGIVLLAAGKGRESLADLKEAVLMPSATKYLHLASALASEQQIDAARQAFAEAKKIGFTATHLSSGDRRRLKALETALGQ
jgi:tetratricopeptide (TPR) repeat protein